MAAEISIQEKCEGCEKLEAEPSNAGQSRNRRTLP